MSFPNALSDGQVVATGPNGNVIAFDFSVQLVDSITLVMLSNGTTVSQPCNTPSDSMQAVLSQLTGINPPQIAFVLDRDICYVFVRTPDYPVSGSSIAFIYTRDGIMGVTNTSLVDLPLSAHPLLVDMVLDTFYKDRGIYSPYSITEDIKIQRRKLGIADADLRRNYLSGSTVPGSQWI